MKINKLALVTTLSMSLLSTQASANPFLMEVLDSGYKVAAEGKCGEGKCGSDKPIKPTEGKCGEGKCGSDKKLS